MKKREYIYENDGGYGEVDRIDEELFNKLDKLKKGEMVKYGDFFYILDKYDRFYKRWVFSKASKNEITNYKAEQIKIQRDNKIDIIFR